MIGLNTPLAYGAAAAVLALGALALWQRGEIADGSTALATEVAAHAKTREKNAIVLSDLVVKTAAARDAALKLQASWQELNGKLETHLHGKLENAQTNNRNLGADGTRRVFIRAVCPAVPSGATATADVPSVPAPVGPVAQSAEIAPELRQPFWATRGVIAEENEVMAALQRYAVACYRASKGETVEAPTE